MPGVDNAGRVWVRRLWVAPSGCQGLNMYGACVVYVSETLPRVWRLDYVKDEARAASGTKCGVNGTRDTQISRQFDGESSMSTHLQTPGAQ